jgi:hypothetical protein
MTDQKVLTIDDKEYEIDGFSNQQKYMLNQVQDLTNKANSLQFQLDQANVAKDFFSQSLISSLQNPEAEEVVENVAGTDIAD